MSSFSYALTWVRILNHIPTNLRKWASGFTTAERKKMCRRLGVSIKCTIATMFVDRPKVDLLGLSSYTKTCLFSLHLFVHSRDRSSPVNLPYQSIQKLNPPSSTRVSSQPRITMDPPYPIFLPVSRISSQHSQTRIHHLPYFFFGNPFKPWINRSPTKVIDLCSVRQLCDP